MIILSKLEAPQIRTKTLFRTRLTNLLEDNLHKKVILICAGAGYGKTTLLSQFLSSNDISYVYYHLEKSDAEPAIFLSHLIAGLRRIEPNFGKKTESLSHFFNYSQKYHETIVGTFLNEITGAIDHDIYIILEDYHTLYPSEEIDNILTYLLDHLPPQVHMIISSRIIPPIAMAQLRARDEIFEIRTEHLRFTEKETKELFSSIHSISLKDSEFDWIVAHTEGWPTSLRLMLQSADYLVDEKASNYMRRILEGYYHAQSNIFNYFAQEIFSRESKKIRQFLVNCSAFEWLSPDVCDAVTKQNNSTDILAELTKRNAFLMRIPDIGYRFHNLFRDFLRSKLIDIVKAQKLYRKAGDFYSKGNMLEEATQFYLKAKNYDKASVSIEHIASKLIWQGRSAFLCSCIEKIPQSIRHQRPILLMNYADSLTFLGRSDEARKNCSRAAKMLKPKSGKSKQYANALYKLGGMFLNQGKLIAAKMWFKKALSVCPKNAYLIRASVLNSMGSWYRAIGSRNLHEATKYFQEALQIAHRKGFKALEASIYNNFGMNDFKMGNLHKAYSKLTKTAELLRDNPSPGCGGGFTNAMTMSLFLGSRNEARSILDSGIKICGRYDDMWSMATIWHGYALFYQEFGELDKAKQFITKAIKAYEKLGHVALIIGAYAELCDINIKAGDLVDAEQILSKVWLLKENRSDLRSAELLLTEAQLRIAQMKYADAEVLLNNALKISQRYKRHFSSFLINLKLSGVFYFQNKASKALSKLRNVVTVSRSNGYDYLLARELQSNKWMLQILRKRKLEWKYILSIVDKYRLDAHWIDAYFFGIPKVAINDKEIDEASWVTMKSKKLFFYLSLNKNRKVNHDVLIDALWPDASYKNGRNNLRKALQHIKQPLKSFVTNKDELIKLGRGFYQIPQDISVWLDVDEFQSLIKQAKNLKKQSKKYDHCLKKALSLYKNGFCTGWYDSWVEETRHFYKGLYEECLTLMADLSVSRKNYKEAITLYKKLLSLNFLNEEYHRKLMRAYSAINEVKEIIKDFNQLKKILKKELDSKPQQNTIELFNSLKCLSPYLT